MDHFPVGSLGAVAPLGTPNVNEPPKPPASGKPTGRREFRPLPYRSAAHGGGGVEIGTQRSVKNFRSVSALGGGVTSDTNTSVTSEAAKITATGITSYPPSDTT